MRYQIRCVCGHLSAFEIIPMPVVPSHGDKKISDEPPNRVAQLEEENTALLREFGEYAFNAEVVAPQMLELELEANPWIGAKQYKEDWIETFFDAILEGK